MFWALCFLFVTVSAVVQKPEFVKINGKGLLQPRIVNNLRPRISNGHQARDGDFPWHVNLVIQYRTDGPNDAPTFCSAAILNEKWLLTQAECITGASKLRADFGSVHINKPLLSVYPDSYTLHPQYDKNKFKNNIALLRLPEKLDFIGANGKFAPVQLPSMRQIDELFVNKESYFTGYGYPSQHSNNVSERLLFARQTIIPNNACALHYGSDLELISPKVICSQSTNVGQGPCVGDGGDPLVINEYGTYTLVGLLSFNHGDGGCGRLPVPAVFTRITAYYEWIERITGYKFRV